MKQFILFILLFASIRFSYAQTLTTSPEFPTANQSLTVIFDASGSELAGTTDDLYAHTGVTVDGQGQWQHVIGTWGSNTEQPKFTKTGTDLYELQITPDINTFYGLSDDETAVEICMVIRNAASDTQTGDMFITIYQESLDINITKPDTSKIYEIGQVIDIEAVSLSAVQMTLFINDIQVQTSNSNSISYSYTINLQGDNEIKVEASDGTETQTESIRFLVRQDNDIQDLPQANLKDGINYIDDNTVTLVLYAPNKNYVFVKGSFNNWQLEAGNQMKQTPDGKRYWLTLSGLTAGEEYAYQYIIDGDLYIADPYTDKVLDPWNDSWISSATYPDLMPYPDDFAEGILSVFQTAQTPYNWQVTNFQKPDPQNLIIYELHIRDFLAAHDYKTLIDTFDYFKNLKVNAIELMPVNEFEGNSSWGYNPSFYFAPDKYYGTKHDLKTFIDTCHANGIAVILDMVLNHSYGQSPFVQMYFDADAGDWGQPSADNPWYNQTSPNTIYSWGYDFNHESPDTKELTTRITRYWIQEYHIDGYRFDFTKGFTNTSGDGWAYDPSRIQILKNLSDSIWATDEDAYVILEHLTDNSEEKVLAGYGMLLWGNMNYNYSQASMGWTSDSDISWISYLNRGWSKAALVGYAESHDEERMMFKNLAYGNGKDNYQIQELNTALERIKLAATFFITVPGPKMIWQFGELGYDISIDNPCRVCEKPILWDDYYQNDKRLLLYNFYAQLNDIKQHNKVFQSSDFNISASGNIKQIVIKSEDNDVVIIGNFGVTKAETTADFTRSGTWHEFFSGTEAVYSPDDMLALNAGEYRMYSTQKLTRTLNETAPVASQVKISGQANVGNKLSVNYTFYDADGDAEAQSKFQWYRLESGEAVIIQGADNQIYTPTNDDADMTIWAEVTPVSQADKYPEGISVASAPVEIGLASEQPFYPTYLTGQSLNLCTADTYTILQIADLYGHIVFQTNIGNNPASVEIPNIKSGMYIIKFSSDTKEDCYKLIKL